MRAGKGNFGFISFILVLGILLYWISQPVSAQIPDLERKALIALYDSTNGPNWTNNNGWKTPPLDVDGFALPGTENTWYGIYCDPGNTTVQRITMWGNNLVGTIPPELGNLANLQDLYLNDNQLSGSIPLELANLAKLKRLLLCQNQLSGSIPPELGNMANLGSLYLYSNQLSGSIPPELANLENLLTLFLDRNQLSGSIPPELGNMANLGSLYLYSNQLSGSIPPELANLTNLQYLYLFNNQLSGSIPPELGNLENLISLSFSSNQLRGSIPPGLGNLTNLIYLNLSSNQLRGSIPSNLTNLMKLENNFSDLRWNALYTNSNTLRTFLNSKQDGGNWESTQTIAPPDVAAASASDSSIDISWTPIIYTSNTGGYRVYYSTSSGGPYKYFGMTANKTGSFLTVTGLNPGTTYYFVVQTRTNLHANNRNRVSSEYTSEVSATTNTGVVTYILTVNSSPETGANITVTPNDNSGNGNGVTNFTGTYDEGTVVTLTAPASLNGKNFLKWSIDGIDYTNLSIQVTMDTNHTAVAYYVSAGSSGILLNRTYLNFASIVGANVSKSQDLTIDNIGSGKLKWTASGDASWLEVSPSSGTGSALVKVMVNPSWMAAGTYTGTVIFSAHNAANSPQTVGVSLKIYESGATGSPFGTFETPLHESTVMSNIAVTGWVLDDIGVESVKIYRGEVGNPIYIGDAVLVDGARPDVETAYPQYPMNYRAGWGYMLLTNFLPNGGNGTFNLYAIATDTEGNTVTLGTKTIICDNANAVKPFGAIDTPTQGGTASGSDFVNWGWVLTPQPNSIPLDGTTIDVWVDGVNLGHPFYNIYRADIASLFPGYANSNGAVGYFYLDTTTYENGVHTIQWTAADSGDNTDGIGSRYFTIMNTGAANSAAEVKNRIQNIPAISIEKLKDLPINSKVPLKIRIGFQKDIKPQEIYPGDKGQIKIETKELERVELDFSDNSTGIPQIYGYMKVGHQFRPFPVGSTLDSRAGKFYWQPGPGFIGEYRFIFIERSPKGEMYGKNIMVKILPGVE